MVRSATDANAVHDPAHAARRNDYGSRGDDNSTRCYDHGPAHADRATGPDASSSIDADCADHGARLTRNEGNRRSNEAQCEK